MSNRIVPNSTGGSGGGANVASQSLTGVQSGPNVTIDLTQLANPFVAILNMYRNGNSLTLGDTDTGWDLTGSIATIYNSTASVDQYSATYTF